MGKALIQSPLRSSWVNLALPVYFASTLVSMATMSLGVGFLGVAVLVDWFRSKKAFAFKWTNPERWIFWVSVLNILAIVLSLVFAPDPVAVTWPRDIAKIWYFGLPFLIVAAWRLASRQGQQRAVLAWLVTFGCLSIVGVIQFFTGWPRPQMIPGLEGYYHSTLFVGHHLSVASIWIFPFFYLVDDTSLRKNHRTFYWIAVVFGFLTLIFTYSRMLWIALPVGGAIWMIMRLKGPRVWLSLLGLVAVLAGVFFVPQVQNRMRDSLGTRPRYELWDVNYGFFKEHPWFGVGFRKNHELSGPALIQKTGRSDVFAGHAHNAYLDAFAGTGFVGGLLWLLFLGSVVWFSRSHLAAWVVFLMNGMTQQNFWEGKVTHQVMLMLALALVSQAKGKK